MTAAVGGGLLLGLASAGAIGGGFSLQHRGAAALEPLRLRNPLRSLGALFRAPVWLGGSLLGLGGWAAYILALRLAPLSLVQAASAGGLVVLALAGRRPSRRELAGTAGALLGLVLLGVSLTGDTHSGSASPAVLGGWFAASALAAALAAGPAVRLLAPGAGLGMAAGILYAAADVATKDAVRGGVHLALVPVVLAASGLAFVALQLSFQRGGRLATAGLATLWMNALPIAAGTLAFHEGFPGGAAGAARGAAFVLLVSAGAVLARGEFDDCEDAGISSPAQLTD